MKYTYYLTLNENNEITDAYSSWEDKTGGVVYKENQSERVFNILDLIVEGEIESFRYKFVDGEIQDV